MMPAPARAVAPSLARALVPVQASVMERKGARRAMAEPKAIVVVLMLVAEMMMAMARVVVEIVIAESLMDWSGGQ